MSDNIVKRVCKELNITQRELAERIGMSADSLNVAVSNNKFSKQTQASINLVLENETLKKELSKYEKLKNALKDAIL
ncbi:helix-turn-helix domain-containing protein [Campylobacter majalis]|uniref:helix-turn-helix domain-containing protein n=1 Tax=Campylobacter majalis TaxID=2790656 RepID=UPI003D6873CF